jgi:OTU domain-containing protein 6
MSEQEGPTAATTTTATTANSSNTLSAEIKSLRAQLMALKKSVSPGDKKQKRAIEQEVGSLEKLIESKQALLSTSRTTSNTPDTTPDSNAEKRSTLKAKRERKLKEREAAWEANRQAALTEASSRPDWQGSEASAFAHRLQERGFEVLEVAADGHCLFGAIGCQLPQVQDHWWVRGVAADWMLKHADEFAPFLELETVSFPEYCEAVRRTGQWGGQMELEALSQALPARITVVQAVGDDLVFGEDGAAAAVDIYLSYHRHAFSLGEHYNALIKK